MPSTTVKRPMNPPRQAAFSDTNQAAYQRPLFFRCFLADAIALPDETFRSGKFGVAIVMNRGQRFSQFHAIADALVEFEAHAMINLVFLFFTATAEHGERDAKSLAIRAGNKAARGTGDAEQPTSGGQ